MKIAAASGTSIPILPKTLVYVNLAWIISCKWTLFQHFSNPFWCVFLETWPCICLFFFFLLASMIELSKTSSYVSFQIFSVLISCLIFSFSLPAVAHPLMPEEFRGKDQMSQWYQPWRISLLFFTISWEEKEKKKKSQLISP